MDKERKKQKSYIQVEKKQTLDKDRKYWWSLFLQDDNSVADITFIAIEEFGEIGTYTIEDIRELRKILEQEPRPIWSEDQWTIRQQLNNYSTLIRSKLKKPTSN